MRALERIPYDIWHLIFQFVCTDGGYSGGSLALTSKSFRAFSASTRFYSLTLSSVQEIKSFLVCYERIRRNNTDTSSPPPSDAATSTAPPIQHLLLSFLPSTSPDIPQRAFRKWTDYARTSRALELQVLHDHRAWEAAKTRWNRDFVQHATHLLRLAAPALRTLAVLQCGAARLPLLPARLPALRELTLLADDRLFLRVPGPGALVSGENDPSDFCFYGVPAAAAAEGELESDAGAGAPFPALTHLHVVCSGPKLHPWERTLPRWAALAPALTHLRVSQATPRLPRVFAEMLGVAPLPLPTASPHDGGDDEEVGEEHGEGVPLPDPEPTCPRLRVLVVQMSGARRSVNGDAPDSALREVERLADACMARRARDDGEDADDEDDEGGGGRRVVVLRSRAYQPDYWEARLRWEWEQRLAGGGGGGGCWGGDEADEDAWKVFGVAGGGGHGKRGKNRQAGEAAASPETGEGAANTTSRWRRVLAKIPRPRRRSTVH